MRDPLKINDTNRVYLRQPHMPLEILDNMTLFKVSGADARNFLQGQLTNDINNITDSWQFSGYCNPKGRLLALLQLWQYQDDFFAFIDSSIADGAIKRLQMYVLRSDVTIETLPEAKFYACFSKQDFAGLREMEMGDVIVVNNHQFALSYGSRSLIIELTDELSGEKGDRWLNQNIQNGLPTLNINTQELFIPQMLNLDVLNGISFKKGCYTGQEIVARMHYLGKLKQRMYLCDYGPNKGSNLQIHAGDKILADGNTVGTVVSAGSTSFLAVLRIDAMALPSLTTEAAEPIRVSNKQPYALPVS